MSRIANARPQRYRYVLCLHECRLTWSEASYQGGRAGPDPYPSRPAGGPPTSS